MFILSPVPAQLVTDQIIEMCNMNYQPLLRCTLNPHSTPRFPNDSLRIEALPEGISSFVLLVCFSVASFLFVIFTLASESWVRLFFNDIFKLISLGILKVCCKLNQEAAYVMHIYFGPFIYTGMKEEMLWKQNSPKSQNWPVLQKNMSPVSP